MAGHSKWANIKRRKGAQDAKRSKLFTRLIKEITVATKEGGDDPVANPRLRLAINNAKGSNMPKETIERAIQKGSGDDAESYLEVTYEGYATHGVAIFIEAMTDNIKRTVADIRAAFNKYGGSLGTNGSLEFIFNRKGIFDFPLPEGADTDGLTLELIDAGAEEVEVEEGHMHISSAMEDFGAIQRKLDELGIDVENAELQRIPTIQVSLDDEAFVEVYKLIEALEDNDDIQRVYHNIDATDYQMEAMNS